MAAPDPKGWACVINAKTPAGTVGGYIPYSKRRQVPTNELCAYQDEPGLRST